jgi:monofunctional biosynthetic peptidoglycan transglycosylase
MERRLEGLRAKQPKAVLKHQWVDYDRISGHLKRAVVAAEDAKFIDHDGFDWEGIQRALERNQTRGKVVAGGSTISQQLAKNLFLSGERSVLRKGQEALITLMLETVLDKRRILELYLNVAEWGEGVFGAEAAARHYYGVSAANLGPGQAAKLAAMLPRPRYYDRNRNTPYLATYTERILARMPGAQLP